MTPLTKDTPVRTRDGREAEILATDMGGEHPILARVKSWTGKWEWLLIFYTSSGLRADGGNKGGDLIPIRPERVVWINEYGNGRLSIVHESKAVADGMKCSHRIALHRITLSEDTIYRGDDE